MDAPLVRRCFRILNAKAMGLTITLADVTEEEFRVMELIEVERQDQIRVENDPERDCGGRSSSGGR
jgi:hypothetical protein